MANLRPNTYSCLLNNHTQRYVVNRFITLWSMIVCTTAMVSLSTVLSRIVAPSLIVPPPYFFNQEVCYDILKIHIFSFKTT